MDTLTTYNKRRTPQGKPASNRQVRNNAGGYTFQVDPVEQVRRFLVLGTDSGTYYATPQSLTRDNAEAVVSLAETNPRVLVDTIVDVSTRGAAPKVNPALFALAIAASTGGAEDRGYALAQLPAVARTGTHLFLFARYVEQFRGWGRGLRRAVGDWYLTKDPAQVAFQAAKYRQREGWSHRDLLRLAHPVTTDPEMRAVFDWITHATTGDDTPNLIRGFLAAHEPGADVPALVRAHHLTWEMLPDTALADPAVWDALLDAGMGQTALMRQLPRLTRAGILPQMGGRTGEVCDMLTDTDRLKRGRVHPLNVLIAQRTYAAGHGRGSEWCPTRKVVDALDTAFYNAFGAVAPAGKRTMIGLDVSGSMGGETSIPGLSCREASAALSLVQLATEPDVSVYGFTSGISPLSLSPRQRLDDAIRAVSRLPFGRTDCALPMRYAINHGLDVDTFIIYTDNEMWAGAEHPHQALTRYREKTGIPARLIVVGMTATKFTIADPTDPGMLDVAGFDSAVPNLIADFSRGL